MNPVYHYQRGELHVEGVALRDIAEQHGTPCYIYSESALVAAYRAFDAAFAGRDHLVCYAVKANSNLSILRLFASLGSGFDIVSGGELARVIAAGGRADRIVFSGVGKTDIEIRAALNASILCFNVESASELDRIAKIAGEMGTVAPVSLRVNPDVDAKTHPYISTGLKENKFGIPFGEALDLYRRASELPAIAVEGIDCHIGSQLTDVAPFTAALEKVLALVERLRGAGITLKHLDLGGGLGIRYRDESPPAVTEYAAALLKLVGSRSERILLEPGRLLVGEAGILMTRVEYLKRGEDRDFAIVDAAMNDLMRPALYEAWHEVRPAREQAATSGKLFDIVGPVCETADCLARGRTLDLREGDLLALMCAGAYGMSMASNYNSRPRPAEIMVSGTDTRVIRTRESVDDMLRNEITRNA